MRIRHSYDFTVSTSPAKIHWQEVYFLPNDGDTVGRLSAKELSQMTSSVAKACMNALSPHLSTLVALEMTKIGLRMILDSDTVSDLVRILIGNYVFHIHIIWIYQSKRQYTVFTFTIHSGKDK